MPIPVDRSEVVVLAGSDLDLDHLELLVTRGPHDWTRPRAAGTGSSATGPSLVLDETAAQPR